MRYEYAAFLIGLMLGTAPQSVSADAADKTMGLWEGTWQDEGGKDHGGRLVTRIVALGKDRYQGMFTAYCDRIETFKVPMKGERRGETIHFAGTVDLGADNGGKYEWSGDATGAKLTGKYSNSGGRAGGFSLERIHKKSPTEGAKPPAGGIVLFDGTNLDEWTAVSGAAPTWRLLEDGAVEVGSVKNGRRRGGNIITKRKFTDGKFHVEFRTALMPEAKGQGRSNSGVYLQGRYEVQVLDSFGEPARDNEAGGIYTVAVPKENACFPPGDWQTYDITFKAPRFDAEGKMLLPGEISVIYNGVLIHDKVHLTHATTAALDDKLREPGGLMLQDHGNPVQFRNIWMAPLDQ